MMKRSVIEALVECFMYAPAAERGGAEYHLISSTVMPSLLFIYVYGGYTKAEMPIACRLRRPSRLPSLFILYRLLCYHDGDMKRLLERER